MDRGSYPDDESGYENTDSSGTHDHIARDFNMQVDEFDDSESQASVSNCEVCGDPIPPTRVRCNEHRSNNASARSNGTEWSISRIAIAIVPGRGYYQAVAKGAAAFRRRNQKQASIDSFDLIYDFNDEPSKTLLRMWGGELPDAVQLNSKEGTELYETAIAKTPTLSAQTADSDDKIQPQQGGYSDVHIYLPDGTPVQTNDDLETIDALRKGSADSLWVVTAVLYTRSNTTTSKSKQQETRHMFCRYCGDTEHIFHGSTTGGGIWECRSCNTESQIGRAHV